MTLYLRIHDDGSERDFILDAPLARIGRSSENDVVLRSQDSSRFHAEVRRDGDRLEVRDLGTSNGTLLKRAGADDARRLESEAWTRVEPGDRLQLGNTAFLAIREALAPATRADRMPPTAAEPPSRAAALHQSLPTLDTTDPTRRLLVALADLAHDALTDPPDRERLRRGLDRLRDAVGGARTLDVVPAPTQAPGFFPELDAAGSTWCGDHAVRQALLARAKSDGDRIEWVDATPQHPPALIIRVPSSLAMISGHVPDARPPGPEVLRVLAGAAALLDAGLVRMRQQPRPQSQAIDATSTSMNDSVLGAFPGLAASSRSRRQLLEIARAASSDEPLLLAGETGVGKEIVARFVHAVSGRKGPFVEASIAQMPSGLIESELFGHVRGAFSGSVGERRGIFLSAHGGTLFLDEIGEIPLELQHLLLKVLPEQKLRRVGSDRSEEFDVRIVAATNRDLAAEVEAGRFRRDLFYRLNTFHFTIPPLRERAEEILPLAEHFLAQEDASKWLDREAVDWLMTREWKGNVRELRSAIVRAVVRSTGGFIRSEDLDAVGQVGDAAPRIEGIPLDWRKAQEVFEGAWTRQVMEAADGKVGRAAQLANLDRSNLRAKVKKHGVKGDEEA